MFDAGNYHNLVETGKRRQKLQKNKTEDDKQ